MSPVSTPSPKHKTVCVIGPSRLQNELIASALEEQGKVRCIAAASLDEAHARFGDIYGQIKLFLWHCEHKDVARELKGLESVEGMMPRHSNLGLFNVRRKGWGVGMALPSQLRGVFFQDCSVEDLKRGVSGLLKGKSWFPAKKASQDSAASEALAGNTESRDELLTPRERLLLSLIQQGKTNRQIADALLVKQKTIKNYANRLFKKINVSNRVEAALWAKRHLR